MTAFRIPGPLGIGSLLGELGVFDARGAHVPPGTVGTVTVETRRIQAASRAVEAISEEAAAPTLEPHPGEHLMSSRRGTPISYRELMAGCIRSVFDFETGHLLDVATIDWTRPFRVKSGRWNMLPEPIDAHMRIVRDQFVGLLTNSMLPHHISGMLRRTNANGPKFREHKAYIKADGNCDGFIRGAPNAHSVGALAIPPDVNAVAEIHTHPPSDMLTPPSLDGDFRNNFVQLVAEYANGRLWIAHWGNVAILLGQIVIGIGDDTGAFFRPVSRTEPCCDMGFRMLDRNRVRIQPPTRHMGPPSAR